MANKFHVGCSGFQYKSWMNGAFYPPKANLLDYYSARIKSVEINSSFYSLPTALTCSNWRAKTPDDFTFVLKGNRVITHRRRINDSDVMNDYFDKFAAAADHLGEKLVGVLWQFPPTFHATQVNIDRLNRFMDKVHNRLPGNSFEFRHRSWVDTHIFTDIWNRGLTFVRHDHAHLYCLEVPHHDSEKFFYTRYHGPNGDCRGRYENFYLHDQALVHSQLSIPGMFYFNNDVDVGAPYDAIALQGFLRSCRS